MKRIIPALYFTLLISLHAKAAEQDTLKVVASAKEATVYRVAKQVPLGDAKSFFRDELKVDMTASIPLELAQKVVTELTSAAKPDAQAPAKMPPVPDLILAFKGDAGAVDIFISVNSGKLKVYRDGKEVTGDKSMPFVDKESFHAAFIALVKKALPDDPEVKALPAPAMSTADLLTALDAAGGEYYDHYHAIPPTPENYVVTSALTGKTRDKQAFIEPGASQISANGEVLDEWGTPLRFIFTQDETKPLQAWSAGKDKIFGTGDDLGKPAEVPGAEGQ